MPKDKYGKFQVGPSNVPVKTMSPGDEWYSRRLIDEDSGEGHISMDSIRELPMPSTAKHAKGGKVAQRAPVTGRYCKGGKVISTRKF